MYEIKIEHIYEDFSSNKETFDFSNYSNESKYYINSNKLSVAKVKDETTVAEIEKFVGLKPNMYWYLIHENSEYKEAKCLNRNVVATITHNENRQVLLNDKYMRHSMNRTQGKSYRIGTYEINKISLSCFDDTIYIQNNGYDGLDLGY